MSAEAEKISAEREAWFLSGLSLYGQIFIGLCLYLYDHVSTPGYLSVLLSLAFPLALLPALRRAGGESRIASAVWAMICFLDGLLAFYTLCALTRHLLPDMGALFWAVLLAALAAAAFSGGEKPLARAARLLGGLLFALFALCAAAALPKGNAGHLFPLLGYGPDSILRGAVWMCGCASGACSPAVGERREPSGRRLPLYLGGFWGALTAWISAWLLPIYVLARPAAPGWRLLLLSNVTAPATVWSLLTLFLLLLLLSALGTGAVRCASFLGRAAKRKPAALWTALILLAMIPAGALEGRDVQTLLTHLAPFRGAAALAALAIAAIGKRAARKKEAKGA